MVSTKKITINGRVLTQATFRIPESLWADSIHLVGDFNDWDPSSHPFQLSRDGFWKLTLNLEPNQIYQFRYLIDGKEWRSEFPSDGYISGADGVDSFIVSTATPATKLPHSLPQKPSLVS